VFGELDDGSFGSGAYQGIMVLDEDPTGLQRRSGDFFKL